MRKGKSINTLNPDTVNIYVVRLCNNRRGMAPRASLQIRINWLLPIMKIEMYNFSVYDKRNDDIHMLLTLSVIN